MHISAEKYFNIKLNIGASVGKYSFFDISVFGWKYNFGYYLIFCECVTTTYDRTLIIFTIIVLFHTFLYINIGACAHSGTVYHTVYFLIIFCDVLIEPIPFWNERFNITDPSNISFTTVHITRFEACPIFIRFKFTKINKKLHEKLSIS